MVTHIFFLKRVLGTQTIKMKVHARVVLSKHIRQKIFSH
jgi:hypothetical protein